MISAVLVDDEREAIDALSALLDIFCPDIEVAGKTNSVQKAISLIQHHDPGIVFLDVEMTDGTGFDILEKIPEVNFATIFVTAFDQYAIRALRQDALDYLLKPIDPDELVAAVAKAKNMVKTNIHFLHPDSVKKEPGEKKIGVPTSNGIQYIQLTDIVRLESKNNYTFIYSLNAKPLLISRTIKSFETTLPTGQFIRCHQRHIVNLDHVMTLIKSEKSILITATNDYIPVSRSHKHLVYFELRKRHKII